MTCARRYCFQVSAFGMPWSFNFSSSRLRRRLLGLQYFSISVVVIVLLCYYLLDWFVRYLTVVLAIAIVNSYTCSDFHCSNNFNYYILDQSSPF